MPDFRQYVNELEHSFHTRRVDCLLLTFPDGLESSKQTNCLKLPSVVSALGCRLKMFAIDGLVINSSVFPKTHNNKDKYGCSFKNNGKFGKNMD